MNGKEFTITDVVDSWGITKHTWLVFVLMSFALLFDGYDFMIVNSTNLFVAHTVWPDNPNPGALMGSLTTWGLLGMVIGGAISGIMSDKIGRKYIADSLAIAADTGIIESPDAVDLPLTLVGAVIGTHVGPDGVAFAFFARG